MCKMSRLMFSKVVILGGPTRVPISYRPRWFRASHMCRNFNLCQYMMDMTIFTLDHYFFSNILDLYLECGRERK